LAKAVAHADVSADKAFGSSAAYFHTGELDRKWWKEVMTLEQMAEPLRLTERCFVVVKGDLLADLTVADGGTVIVYGCVHSSVRMEGISELVVAGDIGEDASVSGTGILHLFVGGNFVGRLHSRGSCTAWVKGHLRGEVQTGEPITRLWVRRDCTATIRPSERAALLYLNVGGFMAYGSLAATAAHRYTEFNASICLSDEPPGLYPDKDAANRKNSHNRWVIHKMAGQGG
jgi:hypothetical protein